MHNLRKRRANGRGCICPQSPCSLLNVELASNTLIHTVTVGDVQPEETGTDHFGSVLCFAHAV